MTPRIITAEEARTLREAATPGPWSHSADGVQVTVSSCQVLIAAVMVAVTSASTPGVTYPRPRRIGRRRTRCKALRSSASHVLH